MELKLQKNVIFKFIYFKRKIVGSFRFDYKYEFEILIKNFHYKLVVVLCLAQHNSKTTVETKHGL